ncbi:MAG: hypothetical protein WAO23_05595 [Dethiobacteria bacterium]
MINAIKSYKAAPLMLFLLLLVIISGCTDKSPYITVEGKEPDHEVRITLAEIKKMDDALVEDDYFSINSYGTEEYFHFKGAWVWAILEEKTAIGAQDIDKITFIADDGYTAEFTLEEIMRDDYIDQSNPQKKYKIILAWEENHREYNPEEGSPFRLVIGQKEPGDINKPLWVSRVEKIRID